MDINLILKELGARIGSLEIDNTVLRAELAEAREQLKEATDGNS